MNFLREYATHAVRDFVVDEMNMNLGWDTQIRVYSVLDAVLGISRTPEEGAWARGELIFADPTVIRDTAFLIRFPENESPLLENYKHVRKLLLAVENSSRKLVSDGLRILGVTNGGLPRFCVVADFRGRHGFFTAQTNPGFAAFPTAASIPPPIRPSWFRWKRRCWNRAWTLGIRRFCSRSWRTWYMPPRSKNTAAPWSSTSTRPRSAISGQGLGTPVDLRESKFLDLAKSLARVDGALHIGSDCRLHGFACLLDGRAIAGEDRSRGARYNSALRFTAENPNLLVVVVSSDRPVSVIQEGVALSDQCALGPISSCVLSPPTLEEWVAGAV